jgi:DNA polymerase III alpha subunit
MLPRRGEQVVPDTIGIVVQLLSHRLQFAQPVMEDAARADQPQCLLGKGERFPVMSQFHMENIARLGLLKMDFLGLRTLTVIQRTVDMVRKRNVELDIDCIPLDDARVYQVFANGETIGLFQFESSSMRDYLKK